MKLLDTLLQLSSSTRSIIPFCCWYNDEVQIVTARNKKPVCYHQNIAIDQNTPYVQICKRYSDFYSNRTASWQFDILQWGMFSVDVLYAFVLKCTEREKPCAQESPSSVVITDKYFVSDSNWVTHLRLWFTDAEAELSSHPLVSPFPSRLHDLSHGLIPFFPQRSFLSSPLPRARWPFGRPREGTGDTAEPVLENLQSKKDVAQLPLLVNHGAVSAHLLPPNPSWL